MSLKRFWALEQEYRAVIQQIADTKSAKDRVHLNQQRNAIIVEARDIVRRLNVPKPNWSHQGIDP